VNAPNKQELQIVQAFSSISVPEKVIRDSNIKQLVQDMLAKQNAVQGTADRLEQVRRDKRDGNFLGNWWNDRDDKVQDAQLDLSTSIGDLTQTSSRLLIVNTAISKVLSDQQTILLQQQEVLEEQTQKLKSQNEKILDQQLQLAEQQQKINAANKGLAEAKGVTQEQAVKLVGCVVRVTEAERKIDLANDLLRTTMQNAMQESLAQCMAQVDATRAEISQVQGESVRKFNELLEASNRENQVALERSERELKTHMTVGLGDLLATVNQKTVEQRADLAQQRAFFEQELQQTSDDLIGQVEQVTVRMREDRETLVRSQDALRTDIHARLSDVVSTIDQKAAEQHASLAQERASFKHALQQTSHDLMGRVEQVTASVRADQEARARAEDQLRTDMLTKLGDVLAAVDQKVAAQYDDLKQQRMFVERELQQAAQDSIHRIDAVLATQASRSRKAGWAIAGAVGLSLLSLGWQVVGHLPVG